MVFVEFGVYWHVGCSAIQMREEALANHLPANLTHNDTAQKITHQASAIASNLYEVRVRAIV